MEKIIVGSRVKLVSLKNSHGGGFYPESRSNTIGNVGVIIAHTDDSALPYRIKWENGSINSYNDHNIELEEKEVKDIYSIAIADLKEAGVEVPRKTLKLIAYTVVFGELLFEVMQKEKLDLQTTGAIIAALNKAITGE